jgi:hypothetical protein
MPDELGAGDVVAVIVGGVVSRLMVALAVAVFPELLVTVPVTT